MSFTKRRKKIIDNPLQEKKNINYNDNFKKKL